MKPKRRIERAELCEKQTEDHLLKKINDRFHNADVLNNSITYTYIIKLRSFCISNIKGILSFQLAMQTS
ncbi:Uncharacterised protein [Sphingobacterium spiritivorum]|uniref:Uncharacterized protein n=1 Tax=Sphingobacterium spiritivorum ATCC 33861 TaxID=525373 RepID=D7VTL6_SPHSI|nr:hypothetical protein HMPREF0766_14320 [Sphingobacterium spiritivorum ATCC 33861]SUJ01992.1 Uncharacterised protein [Sphingobacterium spiritivorum]